MQDSSCRKSYMYYYIYLFAPNNSIGSEYRSRTVLLEAVWCDHRIREVMIEHTRFTEAYQ